MNDMGISDTPQLSGFDEDFSSNIYNQVYHGLPGFDDFSSNIYNQVYHGLPGFDDFSSNIYNQVYHTAA